MTKNEEYKKTPAGQAQPTNNRPIRLGMGTTNQAYQKFVRNF